MTHLHCYILLNHQGHIFFTRQVYLLTLPQTIMDCKGIYCDCQMLRVHLGETFAS